MGKKIFLLVLSLLLLLPGAGLASATGSKTISKSTSNQVKTQAVANASDTNTPVVQNFQTSPSTVKPNANVQFTAVVTDDSAVEGVDVHLYSSSGQFRYISLSVDQASGKWTGTYKVQSIDENGLWTVEVSAWDAAGNLMQQEQGKVTIVNPAVDVTPPVVKDLQVSPKTAKPKETINFTASATDETGVTAATVYLTSDSRDFREVPLKFDAAAGKWAGSYQVQDNDEAGAWTVEVNASDTAGNGTWFTDPNGITNTNANADTTAPVVDSVELSATQVSLGQEIGISAALNDDQSGVSSAAASLASPSGLMRSVDLTYNKQSQKWVGTYKISLADEPGEWTLRALDVSDKASNRTWDWQDGKTFTVTNPDADTKAPTFETVTISPSNVKTGEKAKIAVTALDDKSGVAAVDVRLSNQEHNAQDTASLTYDESAREWVGWYQAAKDTMPGVWKIDSIFIKDKAGNSATVFADGSFTIESDTTPPAKPEVKKVTDKDHAVTGTAEAGAKVEVKAGGSVLSFATAGENGEFLVPITLQVSGTELSVTATDQAGNVSDATVVVVKDVDAPAKPVVNAVTDKDKAVTGTAEAGSKVEVKGGVHVINSAETGTDGKFSVPIPTQVSGTVLTIVAIDKVGNVSEAATIVVSGTAANLAGWVSRDGKWYYYDPVSFNLKKGWYKVGGTWYYSNIDGVMRTGWLKDGVNWYYLKSSGAMATGWQKDGGAWYYLKPSGAMATGWLKDGKYWYYLKSSGAMATGWLKDGRFWYYLNSSGAMVTGWVKISGKWYFFNSNGTLRG
ncbi:Ig-like domain-containing protein [Neobacillus bataviensis]|uniref:Ig-like domain-containing protein n=1 Tax=Neobacillus bataviensis TaxID=220685 RepID=UPI001CC191AE|nr:Ig-like domain-containing protein [Neobacillus bataviensis]